MSLICYISNFYNSNLKKDELLNIIPLKISQLNVSGLIYAILHSSFPDSY